MKLKMLGTLILMMIGTPPITYCQTAIPLSRHEDPRFAGNAHVVDELASIRVKDFEYEGTSIKEVMKKLFGKLPRNMAYIKGYKVVKDAPVGEIFVKYSDVELGILLTSIASSAGMMLQDENGLMVITQRFDDSIEVAGTNLTAKAAEQLGFPRGKEPIVDVCEKLAAVGVGCESAKYYSRQGVVIAKANQKEMALLRNIVLLINRGYEIRKVSK